MAALNFPDSPTVGQVFGGWMWDGVKWGPAGANASFPLAVAAGGTGANSAAGAIANLGGMPLAGGTFTGSVSMSGNASGALQPVPLQQMNAALGGYLPLSGGTVSGNLDVTGILNASDGTIGNVMLQDSAVTASTGTITGNFSVGGAIAGGGSMIGGVQLSGNAVFLSGDMNAGRSLTQFVLPTFGDNTGSVGTAGGAWSVVASYNFAQQSDPRLKDIEDAPPGALDKVIAIPVHRFQFAARSGEMHTGFDASEVQSTFPDGILVGPEETGSMLSITLGDMLALLWQAVQEMSATVRTPAQ